MACLVAAETYNMAPCILKWAVRESARWVQRGLFHGFCQCPVGDIGDIGPVGKHIVKKKKLTALRNNISQPYMHWPKTETFAGKKTRS